MVAHLFFYKLGTANYCQSPVLILTYGNQYILLLEQVNLFSPALDTLVAVADRITTLGTVLLHC